MNTEFFTPLQIFLQIMLTPLLILAPMTVFAAFILND